MFAVSEAIEWKIADTQPFRVSSRYSQLNNFYLPSHSCHPFTTTKLLIKRFSCIIGKCFLATIKCNLWGLSVRLCRTGMFTLLFDFFSCKIYIFWLSILLLVALLFLFFEIHHRSFCGTNEQTKTFDPLPSIDSRCRALPDQFIMRVEKWARRYWEHGHKLVHDRVTFMGLRGEEKRSRISRVVTLKSRTLNQSAGTPKEAKPHVLVAKSPNSQKPKTS